MDSNIGSILETDKKARARLEKARNEALESRKKLETETEKYKEKAKLRAEKSINEIKENEAKKVKAAVEERKRLNKKLCANLDRQFEENGERWISEIVKRSLG